MSPLMMVTLAIVGFLGGAINAVAGGATLLTFPAMLAAGVPPVMANASSSVALTPGHLFGALAEFSQLPKRSPSFWSGLLIMILGGFAGALLLFITTDRVFSAIIPFLIGIATLTFGMGPRLRAWLKPHSGADAEHPASRLSGLIPVSVYVGYFGAGAGVMLMALFSVTTGWAIRSANAYKNLASAVSNWAAIAIFAVNGMIVWPQTLAMLTGAVFGGLLGGRLLRILPTDVLRTIIISAGTLLTLVYAYKYWF